MPGTFRYFYPCDTADKPNKWFGGKAYAEIEVTEREWQILFALDKEEYNDDHAYVRKFTPLIYSKDEEELTPEQRQKRIGDVPLFDDTSNDRIDIRRAMRQLTEQEREVYSLVHFKDMKQSTIAKNMGVTQGYVSMLLEQAEQKIAEYDGDKTPDGVAWRYWKQFVKKGYMPNHVDAEIEYALTQLVCDFVPFIHWFYSVSDLLRFATKSYLFDNDKMAAEIADYLATAAEEEKQHFNDYYGDKPEIIGALYIRFVKEVRKRNRRGLHESDNIYTTFMNMADKIAKCVHMATDEFIDKRFMPDYLRKLFTINDKIVTYRVTKDGYYQARYRRDGYCIEVASKDFNTMKRKFLDKFAEVERERLNHNYPLFKDFVAEWLKIKRRTVKESTYKCYYNLISYHVLPRFGKYHVNEIMRKEIQEFLFELTDEGKMRTAQKIKVLLTAMFDVICDDYDIKSPMRKIVLSHYEAKKGNAFTKAEEKQIIDFCAENRQFAGNSGVLLLLYTGMRVGEIDSMEFDGKYITCVSEKTRKGRKDVIRKIPLSPMMKKVMPLIDFEQAKAVSRYTIRDALKRIFPDRHIHELRYTFITRAKECGCNPEIVMKWVGHEYDQDVKTSRVDRGYTDYSEEYAMQEINKIDYEL